MSSLWPNIEEGGLGLLDAMTTATELPSSTLKRWVGAGGSAQASLSSSSGGLLLGALGR